jgi:opacity protein-like surface antigen
MSRIWSSASRFVLTALAVLGALDAGRASAANAVGSVNFTLGSKRLTSDWYLSEPKTDGTGDTLSSRGSQPALGVEISWGREGWPALIALDLLHSYDDGVQHYPGNPLFLIPPANVRRRARTLELGLGVRRAWTVGGFSPYLGAGGSMVRANFHYQMSDPSQGPYGAAGPAVAGRHFALGYWVGGGIYRNIGHRLHLGLTGRYSKAQVEFPEWSRVSGGQGGYYFLADSNKVDAGGRHIGLVVGWSFPSRK